MPPRSAAALPIADAIDSESVTSHPMAIAPFPASAAAPSSRSRRRASSATCAPRCPRPTPMQRPSPLDAPTTTALTAGPLQSPDKDVRTPVVLSVPTKRLSAPQEATFDDVHGGVDGPRRALPDAERIDERE